ncbi:MAG: PASTA domain-containing protein [Eubacteriaceae bacterium]|nr:PASTA domain-containing protein [Eubacteriaceae bacterium]
MAIKRKSRHKNLKRSSVLRIIFCVGLLIVMFLGLSARLVILQIFQADELADKQTDFMYQNIPITASRGDIYDCNMNILAKDASCSKIYVFPGSIKDDKAVSEFLSEKLGLSYDEVYEKVSNKENKYVLLKSGVDNTTALEIKESGYAGIEINEDKKRYYSDSSFAQYILGFTGVDHTGLYGVEAIFDDELSGVDGVRTVLTDSGNQVIESSSTIKATAQQGESVVLAMNSVIQYYAESAAYEAYLKNNAKRIIIIVSDPNTGSILGAAAYPAYSLDDPWKVDKDYYNSFYSGTDTPLGDQQLGMWSNPFTSFIYEPGSTFKTITVSSALENGNVKMEDTFYCSGSTVVSGVTIKCHIYPSGHGSEDLSHAVANSCNPAMIVIANRMGPENFYHYIHDYGFGEVTGVMLDGEESGIVKHDDNVNPVDFATISFGQGIGVTPIQMIQAVNAVINGGYLITPRLVDKVIDTQTKEVITEYPVTVVRQVVSEDTSAKMRDILYNTGISYYALRDYKDLKIMGKTGTAQKYIGGKYAPGKYVASFYGAAPYDNPQLSVLVIADEPKGGSIFGSAVAAPVGAKVLQNVYNYMVSKDKITIDTIFEQKVSVPDVRGKQFSEAVLAFEKLNIKYHVTGTSTGTVTNQDIYGVDYMEGMVIEITVSSDTEDTVIMPNVLGLSVQSARELLESVGLSIDAQGSGIAVSQSVRDGEKVEKGSVITVTFEYVE